MWTYKLILAVTALFSTVAAIAQSDANKPTQRAEASDEFGEMVDGIAIKLTPLPKAPEAPFAFELTVKNVGNQTLAPERFDKMDVWEFFIEPQDGKPDGYLVCMTSSGSATIGLPRTIKPGESVKVPLKNSNGNFHPKRMEWPDLPLGSHYAGIRHPLSDLPAGKYRVRVRHSSGTKASTIKINGNAISYPAVGRPVSNAIEVDVQARTPRADGYGFAVNGLAAHIEALASEPGKPVRLKAVLKNEGTAPITLYDFHLKRCWVLRLTPASVGPSFKVAITTSLGSGVKQEIVRLEPGKTLECAIEPADHVNAGNCNYEWTYSGSDLENAKVKDRVSQLPAGRYSVRATLVYERDINEALVQAATIARMPNVEPLPKDLWGGRMDSNTCEVTVPATSATSK